MNLIDAQAMRRSAEPLESNKYSAGFESSSSRPALLSKDHSASKFMMR